MKKLLGVMSIVSGILLGIYVGVGVFLINGVTDIADGFKAEPTNAWQIVWGILQIVLLAEFGAGIVMLIGVGCGLGLLETKSAAYRRLSTHFQRMQRRL